MRGIGGQRIIRPGMGMGKAPAITGPFGGHPTLGDNVFAVYKSNETSGTTLHDELGNYDGSITGATVNQTGILDKCLSFDGSGDYVTIGTTATFKYLHGANDTSSFKLSVNIWVKLDNPQSNTFQTFFDTRTASSANIGVLMGFADRSSQSEDRNIQFGIGNGSVGKLPIALNISQAYPNDTDWHMITVTHDQSLASDNAKLYVDGSYVGAASKSAYTPSTSNASFAMMLGRANTANLLLTGDMDELVFWDGKVLTTDEISDLYNSGSGLTY